MKLAVCHYSYHRCWSEESWDIDRLTDQVRDLGVDGIDYHARLVSGIDGLVPRIRTALRRTGLELAGFSLSTNFNQADPDKFRAQTTETLSWLDVAAELNAPVCRIFGGGVKRDDPSAIEAGLERVIRALRVLAPEAEARGLVLALENHGGLPCTGEEQVSVIDMIGSPAVRATIDVGNYMQGDQDGIVGTRVAAKHAAYVHIKDNKRLAEPDERGRTLAGCTIGQGDVDIPGCLRTLTEAGYNGYLALEYEGTEDERTGVPESIRYLKSVMSV